MTMCVVPGCEEHYGCRLRSKGVSVSPRVGEARTRNWKPTPDTPPAHYANILYDERPGGTKMPVLNPDGTPVRHRQAQREAGKIERVLRERHNLTNAS